MVENDCGTDGYSNPVTAVLIDDSQGCPLDACDGDDLILSGLITSGTYKAFNTITADGDVPSNDTVIFEAGTQVTLDGGFEVPSDAILEVNIDTCNNE